MLREFLSRYNSIRNELINKKVEAFKNEQYKDAIKEYDCILDLWEKELREDTNNYIFNDEYCI